MALCTPDGSKDRDKLMFPRTDDLIPDGGPVVSSAATPFLMGIPSELRMKIYNYTDDKDRNSTVIVPVCEDRPLPGPILPTTKASLSRTCKTIHREIEELLYGNKHFMLNLGHCFTSWDEMTMSEDMDILGVVRSLRLNVFLDEYCNPNYELAKFESTLVKLQQSFELQSFKLEVAVYNHGQFGPGRGRRFWMEPLKLSNIYVEEGLPNGRVPKDVMLDKGRMLLEHMKRKLVPELALGT